MSDPRSIFYFSPELAALSYPESSPFKTQRASRTRAILQSMGLLSGAGVEERGAGPATRDELLAFHNPNYLDALQQAAAGKFELEFLSLGLGTEDCPVFPGLYDYAALAVGVSLAGARALLTGEAGVAFNPWGGFHHAGPMLASGFCYLNDAVLACQALSAAGRRVLYLDVDAHHGDGVQAAFYERRDVLTVSLHESGRTLFPGTGFEDEVGSGAGEGFCLNIPLPVGTYDEAYLHAFRSTVLPVVRAFGPQAVVLELGMDALAGDPLAHLSLTNNVFVDLLGDLQALGIPILALGGGGYHVENTARGWALCFSVLSGQEDPADDPSVGMGGVMLASSEWHGGLRDRALLTHGGQRALIDQELRGVLDRLRRRLFPLHGL